MNSYIWPIDGTLTGTTTPGQGRPKSNGNEGVLHIPKTLGMKFHYQMQFSVISRTLSCNTLHNSLSDWIGFMAYQPLLVI